MKGISIIKKQFYSFLKISLFTLILTTVGIFPQIAFAQTYNNATLKPVPTNDRKIKRIKELENDVSLNLLEIKRQKSFYLHHKNNMKKVTKIMHESVANMTLLYTENILTTKTSYDPRKFAASIKSLRDQTKRFLEASSIKLKNIKEKIALFERQNLALEKEINLLREKIKKQIST